MLLSPLEIRRITICTWRTENSATLEQTAAQFECSTSAVSQAERWFKSNRLHNLEAHKRLMQCRAEKIKQLRWLQRKMRAAERWYKSNDRPAPMSAVAQFSRSWNQIHTEIAELDGLINRVLNVNVGGADGNELKITLHTENGGN